jgi:hypothetical protein
MTDKAKRRRRELAERMGVSRRTAANIIRKQTAERREANTARIESEANANSFQPTYSDGPAPDLENYAPGTLQGRR